MNTPSPTVRVKRDGPRGWHNIAESSYDPKVHTLVDEDSKSEGDAPKGLADMTNPELVTLAEAENIDLGKAKKKADLIAAIELGREEKAEASGEE